MSIYTAQQDMAIRYPEAVMIFGIYEYNRRIRKNLYLLMKIKDLISSIGFS
jgi:hypothetical protein